MFKKKKINTFLDHFTFTKKGYCPCHEYASLSELASILGEPYIKDAHDYLEYQRQSYQKKSSY